MRRAWHLPKDSDPGHRGWRQTAPLSDRLGRPQRQAAGPWRISRVLRKGAAGARVPESLFPLHTLPICGDRPSQAPAREASLDSEQRLGSHGTSEKPLSRR